VTNSAAMQKEPHLFPTPQFFPFLQVQSSDAIYSVADTDKNEKGPAMVGAAAQSAARVIGWAAAGLPSVQARRFLPSLDRREGVPATAVHRHWHTT
jgi:hypothetical protein